LISSRAANWRHACSSSSYLARVFGSLAFFANRSHWQAYFSADMLFVNGPEHACNDQVRKAAG
jgi:hypothetical protein